MFWNAAPAIVEGNTIVIKPSEDAPMSTQMAVQIYADAGIPRGVINLVHGHGDAGDSLVRGDVDHICFTGSADVGQHIRRVAAESWDKTTSCELGSKSACIVFDDVEIPLAIEATIASAFKLSGQRCVSSSRILVQRTIYDDFARRFSEEASKLKTGNPFKSNLGTSGCPDGMVWEELTRITIYIMGLSLINRGSPKLEDIIKWSWMIKRPKFSCLQFIPERTAVITRPNGLQKRVARNSCPLSQR